jgi:hypothetical protein
VSARAFVIVFHVAANALDRTAAIIILGLAREKQERGELEQALPLGRAFTVLAGRRAARLPEIQEQVDPFIFPSKRKMGEISFLNNA